MTRSITLTINGIKRTDTVEPRLLLIHYLREVAGLTGPHIGCETSLCGACTVHVDGKAVKSLHHVRGPGRRRERPHHRGLDNRRQARTPCRKPSGTSTACSAAFARRE